MSVGEVRARLIDRLVIAGALFVVVSAGAIAWVDHLADGLLQRRIEEYAGGGSCKWRFLLPVMQLSASQQRSESLARSVPCLVVWGF